MFPEISIGSRVSFMVDLTVVNFPHPTLRYRSKTIRRVDRNLKQIVSKMFELMYEHQGIGLAANQVGLPLRLFVLNLDGDPDKGDEFVFINPVITDFKGTDTSEEGCLSLPEIRANVTRPKTVRLQGYNLRGEAFDAVVDGLFARAAQHELDHLDGILFVDRVNELEKADLAMELDEFQIEFDAARSSGQIGSDEEIADFCAKIEADYC